MVDFDSFVVILGLTPGPSIEVPETFEEGALS